MGGNIGSSRLLSPAALAIVIPNADTPDTTKCDSCDFFSREQHYGWEFVDKHVFQIALNFRKELISWNNDDKKLKKKISSIIKGYLTLGLHRMENDIQSKVVRDLFKEAKEKCDPSCIVKAYCVAQSFTNCLNKSMARIILHDIRQGCTKFSCDTMYKTEDGVKSIASIFFYHQKFITYTGTLYRGLFAYNQMIFDHIKVNDHIMINTFLSTSKDEEVANRFAGYDKQEKKLDIGNRPDVISVLCTYKVKNFNGNRRALDISGMSQHPDEREVLLLPYTIFLVTKKETIALQNSNGKRIEMEFEEFNEQELISSLNQH